MDQVAYLHTLLLKISNKMEDSKTAAGRAMSSSIREVIYKEQYEAWVIEKKNAETKKKGVEEHEWR